MSIDPLVLHVRLLPFPLLVFLMFRRALRNHFPIGLVRLNQLVLGYTKRATVANVLQVIPLGLGLRP